MIKVIFFDGFICEFQVGVIFMDVVMSIFEGLVRNVFVVKVNDKVVDVFMVMIIDFILQLFIWNDMEGKLVMWYLFVYLMVEVFEFFYLGIKLVIGLLVVNGFYYDVDFFDYLIKEEDFLKIEEKMKELVKVKNVFVCKEVFKWDVIVYFIEKNDLYKLELIQDLEDGFIIFYIQGNFIDLCRGLYILDISFIKVVKLIVIVGVYW